MQNHCLRLLSLDSVLDPELSRLKVKDVWGWAKQHLPQGGLEAIYTHLSMRRSFGDGRSSKIEALLALGNQVIVLEVLIDGVWAEYSVGNRS